MKLVLARELLDGTERKAITPAMKRRTWEAADGICFWCDAPVPLAGPEVQYDHRVPLALNGAHTDENIGPIHTRPCHKAKTRDDVARIAKAKRQRALVADLRRRSRRPMQGRGFSKTHTRRFNGTVQPRKGQSNAA